MNEYEIVGIFSGVLFGASITAIVLGWIGVRVWAWIDDAKEVKENFVVELFRKSFFPTLIHPVCWSSGNVYGFCDKKEYSGTHFSRADEDKDCTLISEGRLFALMLIGPAISPIIGLVAFKVYPVTITVLTGIFVAYIARMARRQGKILTSHINNREAHNK